MNLPLDVQTLKAGLALTTGSNSQARTKTLTSRMSEEQDGDDLDDAIKRLQTQHGLKIDGIVEPFGPTHDLMDDLLAPRLEKLVGPDIYNPLPFRPREPRMVARTMAFRPSTIRTRWQEPESMDTASDHANALTLRAATRNELALVRQSESSSDFAAEAGDDQVGGGAGKDGLAMDGDAGRDAGQVPPLPPARPTQADIEADRPIHVPPIPTYYNKKKDVHQPRLTQDIWNRFHATMEKVGLSSLEKDVFGKIYSAEGGTKPDGTTVAGVTTGFIKPLSESLKFKEDLAALGVDENTPPASLTGEQRVNIYRLFMDEVVGPIKAQKASGQPLKERGIDYLERQIQNKEVIAAVADTLFRMGGPVGARTVQEGINDTYRQINSKNTELEDGKFGSSTIRTLGQFAKDPETRKRLINNIMDRRNAHYKRLDKIARQKGLKSTLAGEIARTRTYRID